MGHHYLPQYYLQGFAETDGERHNIWCFDKKGPSKFQTQVKSVANETDLYGEEFESWLADQVDGPSTQVLKKMRDGELLNSLEKFDFANYLTVMWKRVPANKELFNAVFPSAKSDVQKAFKKEMEALMKEYPDRQIELERFEMKWEEAMRKFSERQALEGISKELWSDLIPSERTPRVHFAINQMKWILLESRGNEDFLTSDNPVYFFRSLGLDHKQNELTFPLSSKLALYACHLGGQDLVYKRASTRVIREINRRTVKNSKRFVFSEKNHPWMERLASRKEKRSTLLKLWVSTLD